MALGNVVAGGYVQANDIAAILASNSNYDFVVTGLAVSEKGAGADMSVDVAVGGAYANDTFANNTSVTNVGIDASDVAEDRIDLVTIDSAGTIAITKGTNYDPATEAVVPPATPANKTLLGYVFVEHGAAAIENGDITDARVYNKNWRLIHWDSNAESTTPTSEAFSYLAYMAASELLIFVTTYSKVQASEGGGADYKARIHTTSLLVDAVSKASRKYGAGVVSADSGINTKNLFYNNLPLNLRLTSSDMTLTANHTITASIAASQEGYAFDTLSEAYNITSFIVLAR